MCACGRLRAVCVRLALAACMCGVHVCARVPALPSCGVVLAVRVCAVALLLLWGDGGGYSCVSRNAGECGL